MVPEHQLREIFESILQATGNKADLRISAVRWFNRLYFDVRKWNDGFIRFLETYPSSARPTKEELAEFARGLAEYSNSLDERYGAVKIDLCSGLKMLSVRFTRDFSWLFEQDRRLFYNIRELLDNSYQSEEVVIGIAGDICFRIDEILQRTQSPSARRDAIAAAVRDYREEVAAEIQKVHELAFEAGASLLTVEEYQRALQECGSNDTRILVLGEVTMSGGDTFKNVSGQIINKSTLNNVIMTLGTAETVPSKDRGELVRLLKELDNALEPVRNANPAGARRVEQQASTVATEISSGNVDRSYLEVTTDGLKKAAAAVKDIAPTVLEVAGRIATFLATFGS